jgi:hypothetical protein
MEQVYCISKLSAAQFILLKSREFVAGLFKMLHGLYAKALFGRDVFVFVKSRGITTHAPGTNLYV